MHSQAPEPPAPLVYAFQVETADGRLYEVLVHEDGLAFKRPLADELLDGATGYIEMRRAG